ncbi:MAG: hypothetical protein IKD59_09195 [Lachnospiraceae bacterium]|nr:hypothetical protein [Lachnospiraceae bacterium]MBR3374215.1 hypothetical protein [Bacillota bacterium]
MQMTKSEIVRSYREAASKRNQIGILADLNACPREDIEKILKEAGVLGSSKKKAAKKEEVPRVTKAKVSRKTAEPDSSGKAETEAGGDEDRDIYVSREISRLLCERIDRLADIIESLEKEFIKLSEDLAARKGEYTAYLDFLKRIKVKGGDE